MTVTGVKSTSPPSAWKERATTEARGSRRADSALCDLSVIVPIHDEEDNVEPLVRELAEVLDNAGLDYEVVFIDDGSTDKSLARLRELVQSRPRMFVVELRRNFGQTAAMAAGIEHSRGRVMVPIDGDMQNDAHDIPKLLVMLDGPPVYDIVSGWRKDRHDKWLTRRVPSQTANAIIRRITRVPIHDFGCTLKAYRREVLEGVSLSSDLHRFLPALAAWHGAKIGEMVVNHRARIHGRTKYGLWRTIRVLLDLVTVKFIGTYMTKPLFFFGKLGLATFALSVVLLFVAVAQKFGYMGQPDGLNLNRNVLLTLSALLAFLTVQCVLFGVVSELLVRMYHDIQGRPMYRVRHIHRSEKNGQRGT
jgi:glycosyltransferase involved in cell wall biosynthesis